MKFTPALVFVFGLGVVSANPLIQKRATVSDPANIGYATLNGGTTGGGSATPVTVTTLAALKTAVTGSAAKVVIISGAITGNEVVKVGANTSVIGKSGATLTGVGLRVIDVSNVIIRNLKINKVLADAGDHIGIQAANNVWVDHVELWSDQDHDKDYYDGLLDITHGCYAISVTNSYFHDHWKTSLVGHSDSNEDEDKSITVTYAFNKWANLNSRTPSLRFGHAHIFCSYFTNVNDGINVRVGAEALVEYNVFESVATPLYSVNNDGYANAIGNYFDPNSGGNTAPSTGWNAVGYAYSCSSNASVKSSVNAGAGATLSLP